MQRAIKWRKIIAETQEFIYSREKNIICQTIVCSDKKVIYPKVIMEEYTKSSRSKMKKEMNKKSKSRQKRLGEIDVS